MVELGLRISIFWFSPGTLSLPIMLTFFRLYFETFDHHCGLEAWWNSYSHEAHKKANRFKRKKRYHKVQKRNMFLSFPLLAKPLFRVPKLHLGVEILNHLGIALLGLLVDPFPVWSNSCLYCLCSSSLRNSEQDHPSSCFFIHFLPQNIFPLGTKIMSLRWGAGTLIILIP